MNDDELKKLWRQQSLRAPDRSAAQLISAMQNQTTQLRRTLLARDVRELLACVIVCVIFGFYFFALRQTPISRLGDLIVIGSSIFIAWKLVHARRSNPPAPPGASIVESLRAELNAVSAQSQLLGSVLWWYLLPLAIGIFVCTWGSFGGGFSSLVGNTIYTIVVIALFAFINRLNQRARASQLLPLEAQLKSLLNSAETGEPLDETHVGNLRTIALSMAAANHVKPVEFKVAFWQLAIFGVPGIVGIWFFLMIGLTDWNVIRPRIPETYILRLFSPLHLALVVPFFLAGLLYSRLIQKTTERAVGISAVGIHLCKGQTLILWDEVKEVRPFRFLHIRNLWLIKESGEKTRMHWTPLERHADLKAAVESFAPANHPIRKYLPLLKRIE
jgi:hypothetical protein